MTHDEMIAVIQAHKDGKDIEYWSELLGVWERIENPSWEFNKTQYRVKPPPIEAWGLVSGGALSSIFYHKDVAEESADATETVIRLIPDPNYTQSPTSDNTNGDAK